MLLRLMEDPVLIKLVAGAQGAQRQHDLGSFQTPASAGHFHTIFDQMTAGAFNDSRGDGKSLSKVMIVLEIGCVGEHIVRSDTYGFSICGSKISQCGPAAHAPRHVTGISRHDFQKPNPNPPFQLRPCLGMKRPAGIPHALDYRNEVDNDGKMDTLLFG